MSYFLTRVIRKFERQVVPIKNGHCPQAVPALSKRQAVPALRPKWLVLIGLLLGISCSYAPLVQNSPGCQATSGRDRDEPFALFPEKTHLSLSQRRQLFKQAYTNFKQGNFSPARSQWLKLAGHYPELGDYVYHYLAQTEAALSQHVPASTHWQELLSQFPHSRLVSEARLGMADSYFMQGDFDQAGSIYRQLLNEIWGDEQIQPDIYQKLARCYEQEEDFPQAIATYHQLWLKFPASTQAEPAQQRKLSLSQEHSLPSPLVTEQEYWERIDRLILADEHVIASQELERFRKRFPASSLLPKSHLKQAQCYLGQQKPFQAIDSLKRLIKRFPQHQLVAEARYKLSRLYWNKGRDKLAGDQLQRILTNPNARAWQDNAGYILARIHGGNREYLKAIENYQRLITKFPHSSWANIARWRLGWTYYYHLGDYAKASEYFAQVTPSSNNNGSLYHSARYWQGRCQEELKAWPQAAALYTSLIEEANYTYYAQLAGQRLAHLTTAERIAQISYPIPAPGDNLSLMTDPFLIGQLLSSEDKFHLERVKELAALSMFGDSLKELDELNAPDNPAPEFWYQLSQLHHLLGDYTKPIRLIQRVVDQAREEQAEIPLKVWKVCYPLNYWPLIQKQAEASGLNPYLIAAVIKQESVFDPESLSSADAIGLMQVIPATGQAIAHKLRLTEFTPDMLYEPETNLALGTHYLAQLIKRFDGNLVLALAAYNAGEKATNKWWRGRKSEEMAQFIENIPYSETRKYIKQVWSNYNNYRRIYQGDKL